MFCRNQAYQRRLRRSFRADVPVVSVGNLTTGGTGKTPFVAFLSRWFTDQGLRVALLSRGYRSLDDSANDEKRVLDQLCPGVPHLQNPDRVASAERAVREHQAEVLILDDGFQHRRLARDLDVVLIDGLNPWGYGHLLPRGLLREPLSSLRRATLIAITRADQCSSEERAAIRQTIGRSGASAPVIEVAYPPQQLMNAAGATAGLHILDGQPLAAFCGIGNPEAFRRMLVEMGAHVKAFLPFPDHHHYTPADLAHVAAAAAEHGCTAAVTTQKDLVKIEATALGKCPLWAVRIGAQILDGGDHWDNKLREIARAARAQS